MDEQYDVVVVGAGVEGSSTAYNLVRSGSRRVLLLEQASIYKRLILDSQECKMEHSGKHGKGKSHNILLVEYSHPVYIAVWSSRIPCIAC